MLPKFAPRSTGIFTSRQNNRNPALNNQTRGFFGDLGLTEDSSISATGNLVRALKEQNFIKVFLRAEEAIEVFSLGSSEISLLIAGFIGTWNRRKRPNEFQVPEVALRSRSGQSSASFKRSRHKLEALDLIRRTPGVRNEASPTYMLGPWFNMNHEGSQGTDREADDDPNREADPLNKERGKKESLSLNEEWADDFGSFWKAYPNRVARPAAFRAFQAACQVATPSDILKGLESHKKSDQWRREGGRFIPHPAKWLSDHRWENEIYEYEENKRSHPSGSRNAQTANESVANEYGRL